MEKTVEERLQDLETFMSELPEMINLRHQRIDNALRENTARFDEMAGRLNLLDSQMGMLIRDMRDLRGGVTRQLVAQDERLKRMEAEIAFLKTVLVTDVAELKTDVAGLKTDVAQLKTDVAGLKTAVAEMQAGIQLILSRLPG